MRLVICIVLFGCLTIGQTFSLTAGQVALELEILKLARSQIGVCYSYGGGGIEGMSKGIQQGANTVGFDSSSLMQFIIHKTTGKKLPRMPLEQYNFDQCYHVPYEQSQIGDLVFFEAGGHIHHVGIISGHNTMIHAPHTGDHVREASVYSTGRVKFVSRCF